MCNDFSDFIKPVWGQEEDPEERWSTDYEGRCGNCHSRLQENDKYCRHCGTRRGEGAFEPYQNLMQCIYGPRPVERKHRCTQCPHTWVSCLMVDDEDYCPECGSPAAWDYIEDYNDFL